MADAKTLLAPLSASDIRFDIITRGRWYKSLSLCRFLTPPVSPSLGSRRLKARPTWTPPLSPSHLRSRRTRLVEEAAAPDSPRSSEDEDHLSVFPYLESEKKKFLMAAASNKVRRLKYKFNFCTMLNKVPSSGHWPLPNGGDFTRASVTLWPLHRIHSSPLGSESELLVS